MYCRESGRNIRRVSSLSLREALKEFPVRRALRFDHVEGVHALGPRCAELVSRFVDRKVGVRVQIIAAPLDPGLHQLLRRHNVLASPCGVGPAKGGVATARDKVQAGPKTWRCSQPFDRPRCKDQPAILAPSSGPRLSSCPGSRCAFLTWAEFRCLTLRA